MIANQVYNYTMEIPLSVILRFGICGVPELVPVEPPVYTRDFQIFEVHITYHKPAEEITFEWTVEK
jgi:hypothetical protein